MPAAPPLVVGPPYNSIQEVKDDLARLEMAFLARRDRRGVFVTAYTRARAEAWADGLALRDAPSPAARERLIRAHNRKALQSINDVLFHHLPPLTWMVATVRQAEDLLGGDWSSTVEVCE